MLKNFRKARNLKDYIISFITSLTLPIAIIILSIFGVFMAILSIIILPILGIFGFLTYDIKKDT